MFCMLFFCSATKTELRGKGGRPRCRLGEVGTGGAVFGPKGVAPQDSVRRASDGDAALHDSAHGRYAASCSHKVGGTASSTLVLFTQPQPRPIDKSMGLDHSSLVLNLDPPLRSVWSPSVGRPGWRPGTARRAATSAFSRLTSVPPQPFR